jgi:AcrR family transcriptional regulator
VPAHATPPSERPRRRRRSAAAAEGEIVAAADSLLRERPFRELTVDEVMRRTGLSRPSFYVYFRDRHQLVLRVVQLIGAELFTMSDRWLQGEGDGPTLARAATEGIVGVFAQHGPVLRALADAAADDPDVEDAYGQLVQSFIDVTARHIEAEMAADRILALNPTETAKALILMNERYLNESLAREPRTPREIVVETLSTIWTRTLYGRDPVAQAH